MYSHTSVKFLMHVMEGWVYVSIEIVENIVTKDQEIKLV